MNQLDKSIKDHYLDKHLSESAIDRILAKGDRQTGTNEAQQGSMLEASSAQLKTTNRFTWLRSNNWQVASLVFFTAIIIGIFIGQNNQLLNNVNGLVLEEIAMNHNKRLAVEYPITEYESLRTAMARLDFELSRPAGLPANYQLIGGRYCSIQGRLAAQLKVKDIEAGRVATLYVTPITRRLSAITDMEAVQDNVNIKLWIGDNMLYGLATD